MLIKQKHEKKSAILPKVVITAIIAALVLCCGILASSCNASAAPVVRAEGAQCTAVVNAEAVSSRDVNSSGFAGGDGSADNPFLIETPEQLDNVRNFSLVYDGKQDLYLVGAFFKLTADIDLTAYLAPGGGGYQQEDWGDKGWKPIDIAESTFDGNGHTISGLWCDRGNENFVGLFGKATSAYIKNARLVLAEKGITGRITCGGIVGEISTQTANKQSAKISNCKVSGDVTAALSHTSGKTYFPSGQAGLIAGSVQYAEIDGCEADGTVTGLVYLGGIVGSVYSANIYNSIFRGEIVTTAPSEWKIICAAGIAGRSWGNNVFKNCFYYGVGGLDERIAGIVGFNGSIGTDFEALPLTPPEICGCYFNADAVKSPATYAEPDERWDADCGDDACDHTACDGSEYQVFAVIENSRGLTSLEMQDKSSFAGWDFETVWGFDKDGNLVLRAFGNAYTAPQNLDSPSQPPKLLWLWITLGCVLGAGLLMAVVVALHKHKKSVYVAETTSEVSVVTEIVTVTETVEVPLSPLSMPDTLTAREKEIAELIVAGKSTKEMLDMLFISHNTLKRHIHNLFEKTGAVSQKDFILKYALGVKNPPEAAD